MANRPLTPKQAAFVQEYLVDLNGAAAARRAGYKAKNADQLGTQLLGKTSVTSAIQAAIADRAARTAVTQDRVVLELARVAFADMSRLVKFENGQMTITETGQLSEDDRRALSELSESVTENGRTRKLKVHDKLKALELLGKHLGMFVDKQEISGPNGGPLEINSKREQLLAILLG